MRVPGMPRKKKRLLLAIYYDGQGLTIVRRKGLTPAIESAICDQMVKSHTLVESVNQA